MDSQCRVRPMRHSGDRAGSMSSSTRQACRYSATACCGTPPMHIAHGDGECHAVRGLRGSSRRSGRTARTALPTFAARDPRMPHTRLFNAHHPHFSYTNNSDKLVSIGGVSPAPGAYQTTARTQGCCRWLSPWHSRRPKSVLSQGLAHCNQQADRVIHKSVSVC